MWPKLATKLTLHSVGKNEQVLESFHAGMDDFPWAVSRSALPDHSVREKSLTMVQDFGKYETS